MEQIKRIVIADNSRELCSGFAEALKVHNEFALAGIANDGKQAIHMVRELQPDVLVLDLMIAKEDCLTILKEVRETEKPPVVISISRVVTQYVAQAINYLGSKYTLLKPFDMNLLIEKIQELTNE